MLVNSIIGIYGIEFDALFINCEYVGCLCVFDNTRRSTFILQFLHILPGREWKKLTESDT